MAKQYESEYQSHNGKKIKIRITVKNNPSEQAIKKFVEEAKNIIFKK